MKRDPREQLLVDFGRRVASIRVSQGLTQEQLADRVGKATRYIQQVEAGDQNVTLLTLGQLAEALNCQPSVLLLVVPE